MSVDEMDEFTCQYAYAYGEWQYNEGYQKGYEQGKKDAVKHGLWVINKKSELLCYKCSECGYKVNFFWNDCGNSNYCPNCGAKMDGDNNETD